MRACGVYDEYEKYEVIFLLILVILHVVFFFYSLHNETTSSSSFVKSTKIKINPITANGIEQ